MYDERIVAAAGASGSRGALFCASLAISAMRRKYIEDASGPNDTEWKDNGFLRCAEAKVRQSKIQRSKEQFLPKSDCRTADILHDIVVDTTFTIRKENNDWKSVGAAVKREGAKKCTTLASQCSSFAP